MSVDLDERLVAWSRPLDDTLARLLPEERGPASALARAMRYAVLGGGKRLRPILALESCRALGGSPESCLEPAAALELVHAYSLVHDDLPAMDDDDLRRGRPTLHRAFGDATAILAGDALLTLAFEVLATHPASAPAERRVAAVSAVAAASGAAGMVAGQTADLEAERTAVDAERLAWIHRHKTGRLLAAAAEVGAIYAGAGPAERDALRRFGEALGLAFQIADDLLDRTGSAERLGKTPDKDRRAGKATYPALFGADGARRRAEQCVEDALAQLPARCRDDAALVQLARFAVERDA